MTEMLRDRNRHIAELRQCGLTLADIASLAGLSRGRIHQIERTERRTQLAERLGWRVNGRPLRLGAPLKEADRDTFLCGGAPPYVVEPDEDCDDDPVFPTLLNRYAASPKGQA